MTEPLTYMNAILLLRQLDDLRNGELDTEFGNDIDTEVTKILDRIPEMLIALDPSRAFKRPEVDDSENDLMTIVARRAWSVAWQSCLTFNRERSRDLFGGDPIAMVVHQTLAGARATSPLTPERETEIERWKTADGMLFELLEALRYERAFLGPMDASERQEWRRRQARLEEERNAAEEKAEKVIAALTSITREAESYTDIGWGSASERAPLEDEVRKAQELLRGLR